MRKRLILTIAFCALLTPLSLKAAPPIFKCTIDGSVTYQPTPCPVGDRAASPTVEQLNAERQKKLRSAAKAAAASSAGEGQRAQAGAAANESASKPFKCDGRTHCSQMKSCAEAKYFLAHCPGVEMDGDRNGTPCERQWCSR